MLQKTHHTPGPEDYRRTHMGYFGRRGVLLGQLNLSSLILNGTEFYLPFQCGTRTVPSSPTGTSPRPRSTQATPRLAGETVTIFTISQYYNLLLCFLCPGSRQKPSHPSWLRGWAGGCRRCRTGPSTAPACTWSSMRSGVTTVCIYQLLISTNNSVPTTVCVSASTECHYQDLKRDPVGELEKLLHYLNLPADQV